MKDEKKSSQEKKIIKKKNQCEKEYIYHLHQKHWCK